ASEISTLEGRLSRTEEARERCTNRLADLEAARQRIGQEIASLVQHQQELATRHDERTKETAEAREDLAAARRQLAARQKEMAQERERHSGLAERAALLDELEKRHEGVGVGTKEVLGFARENPDGPFQQVRGLLADLIQVSVETAPMIEAALGEKAQYI